MRLNAPLITSFVFDGNEYAIDLAFDNVLDVFDVLGDERLLDGHRVATCLKLLLDNQDYKISLELWNYIFENIIHTPEEETVEYDLLGNPMPKKSDDEDEESEQLYDLVQDAEYIFSSFRQAYNINLFREHGKMHWQEFRALLHGLPSNTPLKQIMDIRGYKPSKHDGKEYKEQMLRLQKIHALKNVEKEEVDE